MSNKSIKWQPYMKKYKRYKELTKEEQRELLDEILKADPEHAPGEFTVEIVDDEEEDDDRQI